MSEKGNWNQLLQYLCWCVKQDDSEVTCIETTSQDQEFLTKLHQNCDLTSISYVQSNETVQNSKNESSASKEDVNKNNKFSLLARSLISQNASPKSGLSDLIYDLRVDNDIAINEKFKSGASKIYMPLQFGKTSPASSIAATDGSAQHEIPEILIPSAKQSRISLANRSEKHDMSDADRFLSPNTLTDSKRNFCDAISRSYEDFSSTPVVTTETYCSPSLISETSDRLSLSQSSSTTCSSSSKKREENFETSNWSETTSDFDFHKSRSSKESSKLLSKLVDKNLSKDTLSANKPGNKNDKLSFTKSKPKKSDSSKIRTFSSLTSDAQTSKQTSSAFTSVNSLSLDNEDCPSSSKCSYDSDDTTTTEINSFLLESSNYTTQHSTSPEMTRALVSISNSTELRPKPFSNLTFENKPTMVERTSKNVTMTFCPASPKDINHNQRFSSQNDSMNKELGLDASQQVRSVNSLDQQTGEPESKDCLGKNNTKSIMKTRESFKHFFDLKESQVELAGDGVKIETESSRSSKKSLSIYSVGKKKIVKIKNADEVYEKFMVDREKNQESNVINVEYKIESSENENKNEQKTILRTIDLTCSNKVQKRNTYEYKLDKNEQTDDTTSYNKKINRNNMSEIKNSTVVFASNCKLPKKEETIQLNKNTSKSTLTPSMRKNMATLNQNEKRKLYCLGKNLKRKVTLSCDEQPKKSMRVIPEKELMLCSPPTVTLKTKKAKTLHQQSVKDLNFLHYVPLIDAKQPFRINFIEDKLCPRTLKTTEKLIEISKEDKKVITISSDLVSRILVEALETVFCSNDLQNFDKKSIMHVNKKSEIIQNRSYLSLLEPNYNSRDYFKKVFPETEVHTQQSSSKVSSKLLLKEATAEAKLGYTDQETVNQQINQCLSSHTLIYQDSKDLKNDAVSDTSIQNSEKLNCKTFQKSHDISPLPSDSEFIPIPGESKLHPNRRKNKQYLKEPHCFQEDQPLAIIKSEPKKKHVSFFNTSKSLTEKKKLSFHFDNLKTNSLAEDNSNPKFFFTKSLSAEKKTISNCFNQPNASSSVQNGFKDIIYASSNSFSHKDVPTNEKIETVMDTKINDYVKPIYKAHTQPLFYGQKNLTLQISNKENNYKLLESNRDLNSEKVLDSTLDRNHECQIKNYKTVVSTDTNILSTHAETRSNNCLKMAMKEFFQQKRGKMSKLFSHQKNLILEPVFIRFPTPTNTDDNKNKNYFSESVSKTNAFNLKTTCNDLSHNFDDIKSSNWVSDDDFKSASPDETKSNLSSSKHSRRKITREVSPLSEDDFISACEDEINKIENLLKCNQVNKTQSFSPLVVSKKEESNFKKESIFKPRKHLLPHERLFEIVKSSSFNENENNVNKGENNDSALATDKSIQQHNPSAIDSSYSRELEAELKGSSKKNSTRKDQEKERGFDIQSGKIIENTTFPLLHEYSKNDTQTKSLLFFVESELKRLEKNKAPTITSKQKKFLECSSDEGNFQLSASKVDQNLNKNKNLQTFHQSSLEMALKKSDLILVDDRSEENVKMCKNFRQRNFSISQECTPNTPQMRRKKGFYSKDQVSLSRSNDELSNASYFTTKSVTLSSCAESAIPRKAKTKTKTLKDKLKLSTPSKLETHEVEIDDCATIFYDHFIIPNE